MEKNWLNKLQSDKKFSTQLYSYRLLKWTEWNFLRQWIWKNLSVLKPYLNCVEDKWQTLIIESGIVGVVLPNLDAGFVDIIE